MKRAISWLAAAALAAFAIVWGMVGAKLMDGDYDILPEAYVALACMVVALVCLLYRLFSGKCAHCGRLRLSGGEYCPHCGARISASEGK